MKIKYMSAILLALAFALAIAAPAALAYHEGEGKSRAMGLEKKFNHEISTALAKQKELGLSDEQVKKLEDLKTKTQKGLLQQNATIEGLNLDIDASMREDLFEPNDLNDMIVEKYEMKKDKETSIATSYAAFRNILTAEQRKALKALGGESKKEMMQCPMKKGDEKKKTQ